MLNYRKLFPTLVLLSFCTLVSSSSIHQIFNYTWLAIHQAGDIAWSNSTISASIPWLTLTPDICKLALGADPSWGAPEVYLPQSKAPNSDRTWRTVPGCAGPSERAFLQAHSGGIYVCPGLHRGGGLSNKCGCAPKDYYCASWGCETTGDTYWKPSSSWDYITVKRNSSSLLPTDWGVYSYEIPSDCKSTHNTGG